MSETPDASFDYGWGQESVASPSSENSGFAHKRSASCLSEELADRPIKSRKPMRKRAKTQEEKEQRAQERVMRNRAAAQVSRERKREYVTTLEVEKEELNERLSALTGENKSLQETVSTLTQRLETMERMLAYLTPQAPVIPDALGKTYQPLPVQEDLFELPTPPGTIRPQDMQSVTSTPVLETLDLRNPAASIDDVSMDNFFSLPNISPDGINFGLLDDDIALNNFANFCDSAIDFSSTGHFPEGICA